MLCFFIVKILMPSGCRRCSRERLQLNFCDPSAGLCNEGRLWLDEWRGSKKRNRISWERGAAWKTDSVLLESGQQQHKKRTEFYSKTDNMLYFDAIRQTKRGQMPCWKRSSEKMSTWTSARIAAACFRKMSGGVERSSARTNAARHGIIDTPT